MFYLHTEPTERWIQGVVHLMNEHQLSPESSRFIIAFFSSLDFDFVEYFQSNKEQISSFSGRNCHILTPLIDAGRIVPDEHWRKLREEFRSSRIPIQSDPTLVFFALERWTTGRPGLTTRGYNPRFFAGFSLPSFTGFPAKLRNAIDACAACDDTYLLHHRLSQIFASNSLLGNDHLAEPLASTLAECIPRRTVFVSYCSADRGFVHWLVHELAADPTLRLWIDETSIPPGSDFQQLITHTLRASDTDYLLLVVSEHSVASSWVQFEVSQFIGFADGRRIVPLLLSPQQSFPPPIDNVVRRLHHVDFTSEDLRSNGLQLLKEVLRSSPDR
jgi:hypothetical protein